MATATITLPPPKRRRRPRTVAGRAAVPDICYVNEIHNTHLRLEVDPRRQRECYSLMRKAAICFLIFLAFSLLHLQCVQVSYRIEQLKKERDALEGCNQQLRLVKASLADPQRISTLAADKLGLVPPRPQQLVRADGARVQPAPDGTSEYASNDRGLGSALGGTAQEP